MALNHLVFTDHGTFRVKADKMTPANDMLSLYAEGKLVATFSKERVIGVAIEHYLPDYHAAKLAVIGSEHTLAPAPKTEEEGTPLPPPAQTQPPFSLDEDGYLPRKSQ